MFFEKNNRESFLKQYNRLSAALLKDLLKNAPEENVIISPFSILMLLTIAAESTSGETKSQITDYLCGKMDYQSFLNEMLNSGNAISGKVPFRKCGLRKFKDQGFRVGRIYQLREFHSARKVFFIRGYCSGCE